jgi:Gas vesicle protein
MPVAKLKRSRPRADERPALDVERPAAHEPVADRVLEARESSILDLLDRLLEKGVMATGDLTLGVAGVDLIYIRLSALLCAADRVLPDEPEARARRRSRAARRRR